MIPEWNSFINGDCMEYLKEFPDNYFSLALVDPPYGLLEAGMQTGGKKVFFKREHLAERILVVGIKHLNKNILMNCLE